MGVLITETVIKSTTEIAVNQKRIYEVDYLRAISFFMVVLQHSIGAYASRQGIPPVQSVILGLVFILCKAAVPMFVFLSGLSLVYTYANKTFDAKSFFKKRVVSIFLPYVLWTLVYSYYARYGLLEWQEVGLLAGRILNWEFVAYTLRNLTFGVSYYHMWFVVMIFQFYLLFPVMLYAYHKLMAKSSREFLLKLLIGINILWLCLLAVKTYCLPYVTFALQSNLIYRYLMAWSDREFVYYLGYFTFGAMAGVNLELWNKKLRCLPKWIGPLTGAAFVIVCWELLSSLSQGHLDFMTAFTLKPEVALWCLGEILFLYRLSLDISKLSLKAKIFRFTSKYSFGSYFIHAMMLQIVCLRFIDKLPFRDYILPTFLALVLGSFSSLVLNWLWTQTTKLVKILRGLRPFRTGNVGA